MSCRITRNNPSRKQTRVGPEFQVEVPRLIERGQLSRADLFKPYLLRKPTVPVKIHEDRRSEYRKDRIFGEFPRSGSKVWTEEDRVGFVLGLYIFGKNFSPVKKFVETKKMGDLLTFYYSKFYNSEDYHLWTERRISTGKSRRFYGKTLFSKWRGDIIMSRLFSLVGEDLRAPLINSSTRFRDGILPFDEYMFKMKGIVGVHVLLTAIGVGQGKSDLSRVKCKPRNHVEIARCAVPTLTPSEIVDILNGYSELTISQSKDLFKKAVWPHLEARGWHSETIENHNKFGLKHSTVFLVHGMSKFSTRLVLGKHYFNSIHAVLCEVALKPHILVDGPEQARVRALQSIEEKDSPQSSLTDERDGMENKMHSNNRTLLFDLNEPYVASDSEGDVESTRVNDDSRGSEVRPFNLNVPYMRSDSRSEGSQPVKKRAIEALKVDSFNSNKKIRSE